MRAPLALALAVTIGAALAGSAAAQEGPVDCEADALSPAEIAVCAEAAWTDSEGALDLAYGLAATGAEVLDETRFLQGEAEDLRAAELVESSQAEWLDYRDAHCAAEALLVPEGLEREAVLQLCLARLNEARAAQLAVFGAE